MSKGKRSILAYAAGVILAIGLLYLALRGVDFRAVVEVFRVAQWGWALPLILVTLISHLFRAWRWVLLLEAIPSKEAGVERVSIRTAFYSVMIGYMVNNAFPRLGEVARAANMSTVARLPLGGVIGTVVVERALDVVVLLVSLVSVAVIYAERLGFLNRLIFHPLAEQAGHLNPVVLVGLALLGVAIVLISWRVIKKNRITLLSRWIHRIRPVAISFWNGLMTLVRARQRLRIGVLTVAMWFCYLLMAYIPLLVFNLTDVYQLDLVDAWAIMIIATIGIALPSPGGIGTYHYFAIQTLRSLFGVVQASATAYAVFAHAAQLLICTVAGFICLLAQGISFRELTRNTKASSEDSKPEVPLRTKIVS